MPAKKSGFAATWQAQERKARQRKRTPKLIAKTARRVVLVYLRRGLVKAGRKARQSVHYQEKASVALYTGRGVLHGDPHSRVARTTGPALNLQQIRKQREKQAAAAQRQLNAAHKANLAATGKTTRQAGGSRIANRPAPASANSGNGQALRCPKCGTGTNKQKQPFASAQAVNGHVRFCKG